MSEALPTLRAEPLRRFKRYPAYKDSGVEWLGEIPTHWAVARISELMTLVNGYPFDSEYFVRGEGVPLVRIRDLNSTETEVNYTGPIADEAWIETGDVIIGMDGDFNVGRWRGPKALLNQRMCCLRPRPGVNAGFVTYVLPTPLKVINDLTYSTTVKHLSSNDVRKIRLGTPPEPEQRAIAAFLDRETARIDTLVAKKERLIELLQEKRTALITRAVTKGLDPTVPMKDSGVEWLGEIPVHWDVAPVYARYDVALGKMLDSKRVTGEFSGRYLRNVDVQWDKINTEGLPEMDFAPSERDRYLLRPGDLLVCEGGEVGRTAIWKGELAECFYQKAIHRLRTRGDSDEPRFFYFLMYALAQRGVFTAGGNPNTIDHLTAVQLRHYRMPFPPKPEQRAIADFLDRETARIDVLIAKVRDAIDRLKELRTALISAAVTGKIDVREEAA